jgi:NAD(P)-dependent dehydrogenase (short-subunit alcohol dehydrogenase family)
LTFDKDSRMVLTAVTPLSSGPVRSVSATKAALRSFVRTWTAELAGKSIRANMVNPGPIETPLLEAQFGPNVGAMKDRFIAMTPMQRIGRPEEIASAVLFLASDESSFITGVDLPVDGGTVAV